MDGAPIGVVHMRLQRTGPPGQPDTAARRRRHRPRVAGTTLTRVQVGGHHPTGGGQSGSALLRSIMHQTVMDLGVSGSRYVREPRGTDRTCPRCAGRVTTHPWVGRLSRAWRPCHEFVTHREGMNHWTAWPVARDGDVCAGRRHLAHECLHLGRRSRSAHDGEQVQAAIAPEALVSLLSAAFVLIGSNLGEG